MNRYLALLTCTFACTSSERSAPSERVIRVTGIPDENPTELQRRYAPMVRFLSEALDAKVSYVPVTDYGAAVQALSANRVDFAWLGGFTHVQARTMAQVEPLVMREIDRNFRSVIISRSLSRVEQLKDKRFAFGSKSSTSGHLMPRHFLMTIFSLDPAKDLQGAPIYSGAHDATVKIVASGKVEAGALNKAVWDRLVREGQVDKEVKVIYTTPAYVDYVWTARSTLPQSTRDRFRDAFLKLDAQKPEDLEILRLQDARRFVNAQPSDFDSIENIAKQVGLLKR